MKTYTYKVLLECYWRHSRWSPDKSGENSDGIVRVATDEDNPAPCVFLPLDGGPVASDESLGTNVKNLIRRKAERFLNSAAAMPYEPRSYAEMQAESKAQIPLGSAKAFEDSRKFTGADDNTEAKPKRGRKKSSLRTSSPEGDGA